MPHDFRLLPASSPRFAAAGLLLNTVVWGLSFVLIKDALGQIGAVTFIALRFAIASLALALVAVARGYRLAGLHVGLRPGLAAGLALLGGYLLQTLGLRSTSAARAGFITGLSVVLVPPAAWLISREPLRRRAVAALPLAVAGLAFLSYSRPAAARELLELPSRGDLLVLGCAACFALQIALLARLSQPEHAQRPDPLLLTLWQSLIVTLGAVLLLPLAGGSRGTPAAWGAAAFLGVAGTAGAYLVQSLAQRRVSAARTALIYTAEPLFAALFAAVIGGEAFGPTAVVGGCCIIAAMLLGG